MTTPHTFGANLAAYAFIDDDGTTIRGPILLCWGHARACAATERAAKWNQSRIPAGIRRVTREDVLGFVTELRAAGGDRLACTSCAYAGKPEELLRYEPARPLTPADLSEPIDAHLVVA